METAHLIFIKEINEYSVKWALNADITYMTGHPRIRRTTTFSHADTRHLVFRTVCSSTFRASGAPDDREVAADEQHKRLYSLRGRLPGRLAQVPRDSFTHGANRRVIFTLLVATLIRCLARSARSRRCTAPISAFLPNSRLSPTEATRVREAKEAGRAEARVA
ncbi:unnamed protein product [Trichogramma brassicae]|uniref:Uncharacterized protein n=1 Tax=Trichogramma brassicae TaxID=86971 RepID=A0A6H5IGT2_9HYME|nr:unnamed protein product [Trichogramma brassicae]